MTLQSNQSLQALTSRLESLEQLLESPLVPGETRDWLAQACDELEKLSEAFANHRQSAHELQYEQIEQADAEMMSRTENLRREDNSIAAEISRLAKLFAQVAGGVEHIEAEPQNDEGQLASLIPPLVGEALALVIRVRMQENALETWFVEAFQRDRGVAD